ncbi:MAG: hypothetical protein WCK90_05650 [archaeon]
MQEVLIKTIKDHSLSSVYLVKMGSKIYIKKTVPREFAHEFYKQKYLAKKCKKIKIPKIYSIKGRGKFVSCIMEYLPKDSGKINLGDILEAASMFHDETRRINSSLFRIYDFEGFYIDFLIARKYLPTELKQLNKKQLKELLGVVFDSKYSIVHGDFHKDQVFKCKNKPYMIDFISSFYGPSILDYTYFVRGKKRISKSILIQADNNLKKFIRSLIVIYIFDIAWFINRRKHEKKSFNEEISQTSKLIKYNLKRV